MLLRTKEDSTTCSVLTHFGDPLTDIACMSPVPLHSAQWWLKHMPFVLRTKGQSVASGELSLQLYLRKISCMEYHSGP